MEQAGINWCLVSQLMEGDILLYIYYIILRQNNKYIFRFFLVCAFFLFRSYTLANPDAHEIGSPTTGPGKQVILEN